MKRKDQLKALRGESNENLIKKVGELSHELMNLRFRKTSSQLNSSGRIKECKREIARAKTILKATASAASQQSN